MKGGGARGHNSTHNATDTGSSWGSALQTGSPQRPGSIGVPGAQRHAGTWGKGATQRGSGAAHPPMPSQVGEPQHNDPPPTLTGGCSGNVNPGGYHRRAKGGNARGKGSRVRGPCCRARGGGGGEGGQEDTTTPLKAPTVRGNRHGEQLGQRISQLGRQRQRHEDARAWGHTKRGRCRPSSNVPQVGEKDNRPPIGAPLTHRGLLSRFQPRR